MKYLKSLSAIVAGALIFSACSSTTSKEQAAVTEKAAIPVKVSNLSKTTISRTIDYTATILPYEEVNMAPSSPGRIEKIYVEEGDRVSRGDNLFLMDRTQLLQLKLQLASLEKDLWRLDTLLTTGSAKQQQYDQLKTQYDVTKSNVEFMEENTLMKAPFNGIITGKYFENGELYTGAPSTAAGKAAVVTLMQINPLKVNVAISEQYYPLIKTGMKAEVKADVYDNELFTAKVIRKAPTVSPDTRTFIAELELQNRNDLLKPGMFARVSLDLGEVETFVVQANAVLTQEGTNVRYIFVNNNGVAKRIEVTIGKRFDDMLEIVSSELSDGSQLVTDGQTKLKNDDRIEIVQ